RSFFSHCHVASRALPSFPTRRSSDLMFVILSGAGELRFGAATHAVAAGMVAVCPAGGAETAHQMIATGDAPLRYIAISTMREPRSEGTRLNSSHVKISYAVFCLKKKR